MPTDARESLPIDDYLPAIVRQVRQRRAAVITAAPGAGKTTRVAPALAADGRVLLLQPRRVAARAIAQRVADEQGWTAGRQVGWHVRFERRETAETRLIVATEGILTARLQQDPLLSDIQTVILDEFHERSIHADLGLALARQAWLARDDLRLVVMSATLDPAMVSAYLGGCPVIDVAGRLFPVDISYHPGRPVEEAVADALGSGEGAVLAFLPGAREIAMAAATLHGRLPASTRVFELHGGLDASHQDAAIQPTRQPRVILATNIAETTLTVPDVRAVVDSGWHKVARYDADRGIDSLNVERVTRDCADQRAGRAGRVTGGRALRLWDAHAQLKPFRQPDIARVDLAAPVLEIVAWGADPRTFEWFERPRADVLEATLSLLERLGAIDRDGRLSPLGRQMQRLPLHPRLGRLLIEAHGAPEAARAVAILSDRHRWPGTTAATACDLWAAVHEPPTESAERIARSARSALAPTARGRLANTIDEDAFRRAVFAAYPDRLGRRRAPGEDRVLLATGTGARQGRQSGVVNHEFLVAVDVATGDADRGGEATIRAASGVERAWITPTVTEVEHAFDETTGRVRARRLLRYDALVLSATDVPPDPAEEVHLLTMAAIERGPDDDGRQLLARCKLAGIDTSFEALVRAAVRPGRALGAVRLADGLSAPAARQLDRDAPADLSLPSGRSARLQYRDDGRIVAAVKLQELFGLADTPRVGPSRMPVTFELLAPNGRPVQVTADLRSFWTTGYQQVRRELRGRYPRHPWPEDPWSAPPTHRTIRRTDR